MRGIPDIGSVIPNLGYYTRDQKAFEDELNELGREETEIEFFLVSGALLEKNKEVSPEMCWLPNIDLDEGEQLYQPKREEELVEEA